jgi:hypothetical protein
MSAQRKRRKYPYNCPLRACLKITRGAAARDFGGGQGGELCASPKRAVRNEPTPANAKRTGARRVFARKAVWLRCSSVEDPPGIFSCVAPRHPAFCPKTAPLVIFRQAPMPSIQVRLDGDFVPASDCCRPSKKPDPSVSNHPKLKLKNIKDDVLIPRNLLLRPTGGPAEGAVASSSCVSVRHALVGRQLPARLR